MVARGSGFLGIQYLYIKIASTSKECFNWMGVTAHADLNVHCEILPFVPELLQLIKVVKTIFPIKFIFNYCTQSLLQFTN